MLSDDEMRRLMSDQLAVPKASMLNPATIRVDATQLAELVRTSLGAAPLFGEDEATKEMRQRQIDFLAWLSQQHGEVVIALYPAAEDGLDDLEFLGESDSDPSEDLPF